jgi:hypothetical protein
LAVSRLQALVPAQVQLELMEWRCVWSRCGQISVFPFRSQHHGLLGVVGRTHSIRTFTFPQPRSVSKVSSSSIWKMAFVLRFFVSASRKKRE